MNLRLHANATTTPKIRQQIQASDLPTSVLAKKFGIAASTVRILQPADHILIHPRVPA